MDLSCKMIFDASRVVPDRETQFAKICSSPGFLSALDQSGGSTAKALLQYGIAESEYSGNQEMMDKVHEMRSRIITNPQYHGARVIGAILFEATMDDEKTSWNVLTKADQCLMRLILKYSRMTIFLFLLLIVFLLILFLLIVLLVSGGGLNVLLALRSLGVSLLLAGPLTEPLGKLLGGSLGELVILLLPGGLEMLGSDDLPATFVELLPVIVGPGVWEVVRSEHL